MATNVVVETDSQDVWTDSGLGDMRRQALREIAVVLFVLGLVAIPLVPTIFGTVDTGSLSVVFAMLLVSAITLWVDLRWHRLAPHALVVGFLGILTISATVSSFTAIAPWFAVVVLVAGFLVGPGYGAALAALGTVALADVFGQLGLQAGVRLSMVIFIWTAAGFSWLSLRPLLIALMWSWRNYLDVRSMNGLLKERQGELNRTLKSLNETLDRLDAMNHELERARRAANQARQLKSEFAVNVSHELRTPLNLIIGFSEMMVTSPQSYGGKPLPATYRDDAIAVYRNARHLSDLVDDILDLGQIEAGRMALHREYVSLAATVDEAIDTVRVLYVQKSVALNTTVPPDLPPVFADRTRLRQIVINLLGNAARFVECGSVTVAANIVEHDVIVSVSDTGVGIAPGDLPHVFDEFWQSSGPRRAGGSGVGLAVCRRFVEMHGGSIWVESEPMKGTTFTFSIPLLTNLPDMPPLRPWETWARTVPANAERRPIAIVSEDRDTVHLIERYFDENSIIPLNSVTALSVYPARARLSGVVVVGPDSFVAHRLGLAARIYAPGIPVIACGLLNTAQSVAERLGVADYMVKPISRERVRAILDHLGRTVRRILVVDDDEDAARLLARVIRSFSRRYRVTTVSSGSQALRLIEDEQPDALFLDLVMPEIDGYALIDAIRNAPNLGHIAIVIVTAQTLSAHPLSSDGVVMLGPTGMSITTLAECLHHGFSLLGDPDAPESNR